MSRGKFVPPHPDQLCVVYSGARAIELLKKFARDTGAPMLVLAIHDAERGELACASFGAGSAIVFASRLRRNVEEVFGMQLHGADATRRTG